MAWKNNGPCSSSGSPGRCGSEVVRNGGAECDPGTSGTPRSDGAGSTASDLPCGDVEVRE